MSRSALARGPRRSGERARRRRPQLWLGQALALLLLAASGCREARSEAGPDEPRSSPEEPAEAALTREYLAANHGRYERAVGRARSWLDGISVDPAELRRVGIKGKKKLVELLDAYVRLHAIAPPGEKRAVLERARQVAAVTYEPGYHDMLTLNDRHFRQDATSYLRAALLMERLGLDTALYRREIRRAHGRLDAHMSSRGPHQRMAFHWYYRHFGLAEPFDLAAGFRAGVIASRRNPYEMTSDMDVYDLTHEIFVPYEFGERLEADFFSDEDRDYLRRALERLVVVYVMRRDPDLTAELVSCMRYLRLTDSSFYRDGLDYLLESQRPDGSWGDYERYRERYGEYVDQGWYLHTTAVALDALTVAFHFPERGARD